jgi:uncharacterized membrane protein YfcA
LTQIRYCDNLSNVEFDVTLALLAAVIGILVGLTGVGAGALMTPLLIIGFGISPAVAIATDLLYASVTKVAGGLTHLRHSGVQWLVLRRLWIGGMIGVGVGVTAVFVVVDSQFDNDALRVPLALVILLAAASLLARSVRGDSAVLDAKPESERSNATVTISGGAGIGLAVSLTSVGAGALGMALLTRVSPRGTPPRALVGTDLLFAVPIALVAGISYFFGGLVDLELLVNLLIGSIPGVVLGSALAGKAPARFLSFIIGLALIAAAVLMVGSVFAS